MVAGCCLATAADTGALGGDGLMISAGLVRWLHFVAMGYRSKNISPKRNEVISRILP